MSSFRKTIALWCCMMVLITSGAYVSINYILVRIGRLESTEKLRQAVTLEEQGRPLEALDAYQYSSRFEANPTATLLAISRLERRIGKSHSALDHDRAAVDAASPEQEIVAQLSLARSYRELGRWGDARHVYQDILKKCDRCAEAYHGIAITSRELGEFGSMVDAFKSLREASMERASPEFAEAYSAAKQRLAATKERIADRGESGLDLYVLAMNQLDLGNWVETIDLIAKAVTFPDAPADAWYWFGVAAEAEGDPQLAIDRYRQTIEKLPDHLRAERRLSLLSETAR